MTMEREDLDLLLRYKHAQLTLKPNSLLIPVHQCDITEEGAREFNAIFRIAKRMERRIIRTPSGGISFSNMRRGECSDWRRLCHCVEITIICSQGMWRFQFRSKTASKNRSRKICGRSAFGRLRAMLKEDGIDLEKFAIENGAEVKKEIPMPLIRFAAPELVGIPFKRAHHIDFHSSYPAGLCNTHPEFLPTMSRIYRLRHEGDVHKAILNYSIGFMQSITLCHARWAHLSRDAIADNNKRVLELAARLKKEGRFPILFNTDGIWYSGEIYHGEGEGDDMGQWHNDHTDCQFRAASPGSYEFIEDGKYNAVVRGIPEARKEGWEWGAIFKDGAIPERYVFSPENGIMKIDTKGESHEI